MTDDSQNLAYSLKFVLWRVENIVGEKEKNKAG